MYNGWKNWETYAIALTIGNDQSIYQAALRCTTYGQLVDLLSDLAPDPVAFVSPEGPRWDDRHLDVTALDALIKGLS